MNILIRSWCTFIRILRKARLGDIFTVNQETRIWSIRRLRSIRYWPNLNGKWFIGSWPYTKILGFFWKKLVLRLIFVTVIIVNNIWKIILNITSSIKLVLPPFEEVWLAVSKYSINQNTKNNHSQNFTLEVIFMKSGPRNNHRFHTIYHTYLLHAIKCM